MTLSTRFPIALLPIRIETRFETTPTGVDLKVRLYPDQIHIDAHEPELTARERAAWDTWRVSAKDLPAWRALVAAVGAPRAAYVRSLAADPGHRADAWTRAPLARLLPDRWVIVVDGAGTEPVRVTIPHVQPDLVVGLAPDDQGTFTRDLIELAPNARWMARFQDAVAAGMAAVISLPAGTRGPLDVTVFGVRDRDPVEEATALESLLDAHHYVDGLGILATGVPTNFAETEEPPWSSKHTTPERSFPVEVQAADAGAESMAAALAASMGIASTPLERVAGGRAIEPFAAAVHAALWPATIGYFLEQMLDGAGLGSDVIENARSLFVRSVRNRGPLPTLRVGRTPYGVLPIGALAAWQAGADEEADPRIIDLLRGVRHIWEAAVAKVPRLGTGATDETVAQVLAMQPVSTEYVARSVMGASYAGYLFDFLRQPLHLPWWKALANHSLAGWLDAGLPAQDTRLSRATYATTHVELRGPIASEVLDDAPLDYVAFIRDATVEQLRTTPERAPATPLLYRLLRHGALAAYLGAARRALAAQNVHVVEPEMIGLSTKLDPPWTWLERQVGASTLRQLLDAARTARNGDPAFVDVWKGLDVLATASSRDLDALVRETLDVCSHRLDAWITGVATARLRRMRTSAPRGIAIGAYGFVTGLVRADVVPAPAAPAGEQGDLALATAPGGYIHVPSLAHTATAALLRSGYVTHRGSSPTTFATDLTSSRVREARSVLDRLRDGESLGQVLGRRIERALLDASNPPLWSFVPVLRELAAAPDAPFAARRTLDGYTLAKLSAAGLPWGTRGLPAFNSPEAVALSVILAKTEVILDAIGDLLVAESVHQIAQGSVDRAAATLDALALGTPPPAELGVVSVPQSAIGLTHTIASCVQATASAHGWSTTARANAEPALEAWAAALLGAASTYRARVRYVANGVEVGSRVIGFDALELAALDVVRAAGAGELAAHVLDHARTPPPGAPDSTPVIDPARVPGARSLDDLTALSTALADVLARARAATAEDFGGKTALTAPLVSAIESRGSDGVLAAALAQLENNPAAGLRTCAGLGISGAVPALDASRWPEQVERTRAVLARRAQQLGQLAPATDLESRLARAVSRLKLLYGDDLIVLPPFALTAELRASLADQGALVEDASEPATWLARAACVRAELEPLDRALFLADVLGAAPTGLRVAQLPHSAGAPWIGRERLATFPEARRGFVLHAPSTFDPSHPIAALVIDTWTETVPTATQTTGIAFQLEQPTACPPQTILLAVPADGAHEWTDAAVEATVREALALAKLRAVDGDLIGDAGHFLPALYFAINLAGDTASTDFTGSAT